MKKFMFKSIALILGLMLLVLPTLAQDTTNVSDPADNPYIIVAVVLGATAIAAITLAVQTLRERAASGDANAKQILQTAERLMGIVESVKDALPVETVDRWLDKFDARARATTGNYADDLIAWAAKNGWQLVRPGDAGTMEMEMEIDEDLPKGSKIVFSASPGLVDTKITKPDETAG